MEFKGLLNLKTGNHSNRQMQFDDRFMAEKGVKSRCKPYTSEISGCSYEILAAYEPANWQTYRPLRSPKLT